MVAEAALAAIKLLLGLAVFAVVGYVGKVYDRRIAGVLLTFPILNGIGILTGREPLVVADSIYAVVVVNGLILFLMIAACDRLPRLHAAPANLKLVVRLLAWTAVWGLAAPIVIFYRDALPGAGGLLLIQGSIAIIAAVLFWQAKPQLMRVNAETSKLPHVRGLIAFWSNKDGLWRLALFTFSFVLLLFASYLYTSKWLGMFSALPVPGLFAVATLSVLDKRPYFQHMRDTVLLGPISVIVFNWLYAHLVAQLPAARLPRLTLGIGAMVLLLAMDAAFVVWSTPLIARIVDRLHESRR